jgi:hypothetical protein
MEDHDRPDLILSVVEILVRLKNVDVDAPVPRTQRSAIWDVKNISFLDSLAELNATISSSAVSRQSTLFHSFARVKWIPGMEILLRQGADINAIDGHRKTPLHVLLSPYECDSETATTRRCFQWMVQRGAGLYMKDAKGVTPMELLDEDMEGKASLRRFLTR